MKAWHGVFVGLSALAAVVQASGQATAPGNPSSGILAGRVLDAAAVPVPAAIVSLGREQAGLPGRRPTTGDDRVLTDEAGRFVFTQVAAGRYTVSATKPGWLDGAVGRRRPRGAATPVEVADGERRVDLSITLWRPAVIAGRVTDDQGDPLVGAEVRAVRQIHLAGRRQSDTPVRARSDDLGMYRFSNLPPGEYLIAVLTSVLSEPPGFAGAMRAASPRAYLQTMTAVGTMPMVFERAAGATGGARPLVGSLSPLPGVPAGDAPWPLYPTTWHPGSTSMRDAGVVRVSTGEVRLDANIAVRLTPTWQVSGVLHDVDGPAAWHAVHLVPAESADTPLVDVSTAVTDAAGVFTFYGVPPGQYIARVVRTPNPDGDAFRLAIVGGTGEIRSVAMVMESPDAGAPTSSGPLMHASQPVSVGDRHVRGVVLTLREGVRVSGRARFEGSASPPAGRGWDSARMFVEPAGGREDPMSFPAAFAPDGSFVSSSLWPGRYVVRGTPPVGWMFKDATWQGRDVSDTAIDLTADIDEVIITFTDRPRTLSGTVHGEAGRHPDHATVLLFPIDPAARLDVGRTSRRMAGAPVVNGAFSLALPPAGEYALVAVPDEDADDWQHPETLVRLLAVAERVRVGGDASMTQALQMRVLR